MSYSEQAQTSPGVMAPYLNQAGPSRIVDPSTPTLNFAQRRAKFPNTRQHSSTRTPKSNSEARFRFRNARSKPLPNLPNSNTTAAQARSSGSNGSGSGPKCGSPRISKLLSAVLNSPLLNTPSNLNANQEADTVMVDGSFVAVPTAMTVTRPPSPSPTADYSIISPPSPMSFVHVVPPFDVPNGAYDVFSSPTSGPEGTPNCTLFISQLSLKPDVAEPIRWSPSKLGRNTLGRIWGVLSTPNRITKRSRSSDGVFDGLPLDGEEGELIDDEACFFAIKPVAGMDIVGELPVEIALHVLLFLDLPSVLACRGVNKHWQALVNDSAVWRSLFLREVETKGWQIDQRQLKKMTVHDHGAVRRMLSEGSTHRLKSLEILPPLTLNWQQLYKDRVELDRRWVSEEPKVSHIFGHIDSVYCLDFDHDKIITGSRDRTIKIWDMQTGKLRATLRGHAGSVLCLKFDKELCSDAADSDFESGFMVSGSSDCTVLVWDLREFLHSGKTEGGPELVKRVLRGHTGGVLDLRIDEKWIVSCSKDALIRVWDRKTLELATTLKGHEGPVNAVGLQNGKVVSASGDGKMMLWDIASGSRIRTYEGHDRGLACIEFKEDLIVSGSNDCKIKVWKASTGECLHTLVGHELLVRALSFDPYSNRLVSASYDKSVKVWDLGSGKLLRDFKNNHASHIFDVRFDCSRILSASHDRRVVMLDFSENLDSTLFV